MRLIYKILAFALSKIKSSYALKSETDSILKAAYQEGRISVVFDIGAHRGRWAAQMLKTLPNANFILFEANPSHTKYIEKLGRPFYISALTSSDVESIDFFTADDDSGSTGGSIYKEKTEHYQQVNARRLKASTLNSIVNQNKLPQPDFIKIDTQGAELDVIDGGIDIFRNCNYILIELPVLEYNEGAPSFDKYRDKLFEIGFLPVALSEIHKFDSVIIQIDFLFVNKRLLKESVLNGLKISK